MMRVIRGPVVSMHLAPQLIAEQVNPPSRLGLQTVSPQIRPKTHGMGPLNAMGVRGYGDWWSGPEPIKKFGKMAARVYFGVPLFTRQSIGAGQRETRREHHSHLEIHVIIR